MSSKMIKDMFQMDNNIDKDFINRHFDSKYHSDCDKIVRQLWDFRIESLSEGQLNWINKILKMCKDADPNKPFHKVRTGNLPGQYKIMSTEEKDEYFKKIDRIKNLTEDAISNKDKELIK